MERLSKLPPDDSHRIEKSALGVSRTNREKKHALWEAGFSDRMAGFLLHSLSEELMTYQDRFNSERYLDMTAYLAIRNIERSERRRSRLREDWDFRRGDLYIADLGYGAMGFDGSHVQGGVRPVVLLQNNIGNFYSPTLVIVPITSKVWKKTDQPTHYLIRKTQGLSSDSIALGEQITTIDKRQCLKYLGRLSRKETDAIKEAAIVGIGGNVDIPEEIDAP